MDRRAFFKGLAGNITPIRPPYSLGEIHFFDTCTGCKACVEICPTSILTTGRDSRPEVDFAKGHCIFCQECAHACPTDALQLTDLSAQTPWALKALINDGCLEHRGITCRACDTACGEGAILFRLQRGGRSAVSVDQDCCTGCGECLGICPSDAIVLEQVQTMPNAVQTGTETTITHATKECAR